MGTRLKHWHINIADFFFMSVALLPLAFLLFLSIAKTSDQTLSKLWLSLPLLGKSILFSVLTALAATLLGTGAAISLHGHTGKFFKAIKLVLILPLFITPYSYAVSWDQVNLFSHLTAGIKTFSVLVFIYVPLSYLVISTMLGQMPASMIEAALLQAPMKKVIKQIILPYLKPSLITSLTLVFIFVLSEFTIPTYFGVNLFSAHIFTEFAAFYDYQAAILHSVLLLVVIILIIWSEKKAFVSVPLFSLDVSRSFPHPLVARWAGVVISIYAVVVSIVPLLSLVASTSTAPDSLIQAARSLSRSLVNSCAIALLSAILSVVVVTSSIIIEFLKRKKTNSGSTYLLTFAVPSLVLGIAFIYFYNSRLLGFIYSTVWIVVFGLMAKYSYLAYKIIANMTMGIDYTMVEVAMVSGLKTRDIARYIVLPLLSPAILAGVFIGFIFSFLETGFTIMVYPPGMQLASVRVFTLMSNATATTVNAMNLVLITAGLVISLGMYVTWKIIYKR